MIHFSGTDFELHETEDTKEQHTTRHCHDRTSCLIFKDSALHVLSRKASTEKPNDPNDCGNDGE